MPQGQTHLSRVARALEAVGVEPFAYAACAAPPSRADFVHGTAKRFVDGITAAAAAADFGKGHSRRCWQH